MMKRFLVMFGLLFMILIPAATAQQHSDPIRVTGQGKIEAVIWLPGGQLAVFGARGIWLYQSLPVADTQPTLIEHPYPWIRSAALSGNILATGHEDGSVTLWDLQSADPILTPTQHFIALDGPIYRLSLSADGARVAVGGGRLGVQVWEFPRQTPVSAPSISAENIILDVALSADGRWLYVTSQFQTGDMVGSTTLHLWNLEQPQDSTTLDTGWAAGPISLSPDGRWLALSTNINDISVYDRQQDQWRTFSGYSTPTTRLFFKADELYLYTDGSLVVVALDTLEMVGRGIFNDLFSVKAVVWADPWFATIGEEGFDHPNTLRLWNWQTAETLDIQFEMALPLTLVEASGQFPDGGLIWQSYDPLEYANISGSQLQITATGQKLDTPYRITYAAFTPDQSRIAVGTEYSQIYWLDATTLEEITIWQLYEGKILLIEFSPDGQEIRIGGSHGLIKTWLIE